MPADWQKRLPEQQRAVHVDDRVPRAQGQPEGRSRTGTISSSPASRVITPNPKTSGGARWNYLAAWGYAREEVRRRRRQGEGVRRAALQERARARLRRARLDDDVRRARHRRRADRLGERGAASRSSELGQEQVRDRRAVASASSPSRRSRVVDKVVDKHGTRAVAEAYLQVPLHARRPGDRRASTTTGRAIADGRREVREQVPEGRRCSRSTRRSAAGRRRRRRTSPTAARSIRSTSRGDERVREARRAMRCRASG